ncbi:DUF433 domain-containing protein [Nodosilinea sp. E11]|uniref:DUF433 domain-containing protein n=1 Tax=Nodosilinea sp. E11 TaxID=3037479 RepID=UPI002934FF8D|nr:DUF433 domain-containing protein [Nodosilinea sp. E11]WOD37209.1 DUF433 domain-containing protein [Nodosilinea sp. E11]
MNAKLVESLVQAIESLPQEDYALFQEQLTTRSVQKTPGVCGGHARIRSTRIAVWTLISLQNQGADDDELLHNFPGLTPFDLIAARSYYASQPEEIDSAIADIHDYEVPCEGESTSQVLTITQN